MSVTISYKHPSDTIKRERAMEDIRDWFGDRWPKIDAIMRDVKDGREFTIGAEFAGVRGYPVIAWYDHYHGDGAYAALPEW